jgi:hypothetical protein
MSEFILRDSSLAPLVLKDFFELVESNSLAIGLWVNCDVMF